MTPYQLQSTKPNGPTFDIISYDPATKQGKLKGNYGLVFEENLEVERLKKLGYKVVKRED